MRRLRAIRRTLAGSSGFTLIEVLMAVSIISLTVGLMGTGIFQVNNVRRFWADDARATFNLRHAGSWFTGDALNAEDALDGPGGIPLGQDCAAASPVSAVTLTWIDTGGVSRQETYTISGGALTRKDEPGLETPIIISGVVAGTGENPVGFSLCGNLLRLDLIVEADRGGQEAMTLSTYLRKLTP